MERLWSPWRMTYIRKAHLPQGCLFCRVFGARDDRKHLVVARRGEALLMLNRFPYTAGHLMVAVGRHVGRFAGLRPAERSDFYQLLALGERALMAEYRPQGLNVGANLGRVAGAGFPGHLHVHLVPRWSGDTNYMSVLGEVRVLPESLSKTWTRLRRAVKTLEGGRTRRGGKGR